MLHCNIVMVHCHISTKTSAIFGAMQTVVRTSLKSGTPILLRPITVDDEARLRESIGKLSDRSRYLRFFTGVKRLPDAVVHGLANADGHLHIAWGAMDVSGKLPQAVAAAHAIRQDEVASAELAFGVLDAYHGQGLGRLVVTAVILDCLHEGVEILFADTLAENTKARKLLRHFGASRAGGDSMVHRYRLDLGEALDRIHGMETPKALPTLVSTLSGQSDRNAGWAA